jgi:A/G-specific adenine glycosylase
MSTDAVWPVPLPSADWRRTFRRRLLAWYRRHARDLPWRRTRDPYAVWVSEIMLQQTQVATVESYFPRFLSAFPTVQALAAASEDDVLRLWEGLGYYRRARQMHAAARRIVSDFAGHFPREPDDVRALPGIGRYTAGAILSIAFDAREPIVEANTLRLLARLLAFRDNPLGSAGQRLLWHFAAELLPQRESGAFNQALMELGSIVCTPRQPRCESCPVTDLCPTRLQGLQDVIPRPKARPQIEAVTEAAMVVERSGRVLLVRRGEGGRWAGMWDFPRFAIAATDVASPESFLIEQLRAQLAIEVETPECFHTLKHGVTRFRITLDCYRAQHSAGRPARGIEVAWLRPAELADYPLNVTGRKVARLLMERADLNPQKKTRRNTEKKAS